MKNSRFAKKHQITNASKIFQITRKLVLYLRTGGCLMNIIYIYLCLRSVGTYKIQRL